MWSRMVDEKSMRATISQSLMFMAFNKVLALNLVDFVA